MPRAPPGEQLSGSPPPALQPRSPAMSLAQLHSCSRPSQHGHSPPTPEGSMQEPQPLARQCHGCCLQSGAPCLEQWTPVPSCSHHAQQNNEDCPTLRHLLTHWLGEPRGRWGFGPSLVEKDMEVMCPMSWLRVLTQEYLNATCRGKFWFRVCALGCLFTQALGDKYEQQGLWIV